MSELTTHGRAAIAALQGDTASDAECARVRARLSALGVAVVAGGASASLASSVAAASVAGPSVAPGAIAGGLTGAAPATLTVTTGGASLSAAPAASVVTGAGWVGGASLLTKLASVPMAIKTGALIAVLAGVGAVTLSAARTSPTGGKTSGSAAAPTSEKQVAPAAPMQPHLPAAAPSASRAAAPESTRDRPGSVTSPSSVPGRGAGRAASDDAVFARSRAPQAAAARGRGPAAEAPASSLGAEGALLASALRALRAGQREHAQRLLDQHEHTFGPHALLARERERMRQELPQTLR